MKEIRVYNTDGQKQESIALGLDISQKEYCQQAFSCAIRSILQNWRQGTVGCKARSDVSFANKKPWKQKGTGRARAGSPRSPLWRSGGVTFGPQARTRTLGINKKQKRLVLNNLLFSLLEKEAVCCLDFDSPDKGPNTKVAFSALKNAKLADKKIAMFVPFSDEANLYSFRNIPKVDILTFDQPNIFSLSNCHQIVFLKKDIESFKDMVSKWI